MSKKRSVGQGNLFDTGSPAPEVGAYGLGLNRPLPARTEPVHYCHWPGCTQATDPKMWGCAPHWWRLPNHLQKRIWQHYRPGQEVDKNPSTEYLAASRAVQEWIRLCGGVSGQ